MGDLSARRAHGISPFRWSLWRGWLLGSLLVIGGLIVLVTDVAEKSTAATRFVGGGGPGNFTTIQAAIDAASPGDTVFVYAGTYQESVLINKPLTLTGENRTGTVVDGSGVGKGIQVSADWVNITHISVRNMLGGPSGIRLRSVEHCQVANTTVTLGDWVGIRLENSNSSVIAYNDVSSNHGAGISLSSSNNNIVIGNTASNDWNAGYQVEGSSGNLLINNTAADSWAGISLYQSTTTTLIGNAMVRAGVDIFGAALGHWNTHSIDTSNTVNGKPVHYWKNVAGGTVPQGAGQVILANSQAVLVENQVMNDGSNGILLGFSNGNILVNNTASLQNIHGIHLYKSDYNSLTNNTAHLDVDYGGIVLESSSGNIVSENNVSNSQFGIAVYSSAFNIIKGNEFAQNVRGIFFWSSIFNSVYHNSIMFNGEQAFDDRSNIWDIGCPGGGNRWSDYAGVDQTDCAGGLPYPDGLGDTPYTIDTDSVDHYPLLSPPPKPDYVPTMPDPVDQMTVGLSIPVNLAVEVLNQGDGRGRSNATVAFVDSSSMPFATFALPPLNASETSSRVSAVWTAPAAPGTYDVTVDVDYYGDVTESNESNNVYAWTINVVPGPITSLTIGAPNCTSIATYVRSSTPLSLSILDQGGSGINHTMYRTDGGAWIEYSSPFTLPGEGQHVVEWYSEDLAGNVEAVNSRTLRVDDTPPATTLSIGDPKYLVGGDFVKSSTPLSLQAVDGGTLPVGVRVTRYRIGGGSWNDYSSPFTLAGEGAHAVEYYSRDFLTNQESANSVQIIVDDTPPTTMISPATGEFNVTTTFTLAAVDGGSGVKVTRLRTDGGGWTDYSGGFTLSEGNHNISYYSKDNLDNTEREKWLDVNVNGPPPPNTPPSVTLNAPIGGEEWLAGSVHAINWTMHDDQDADANLTVYVNYTTAGATHSIVAGLKGGESFLWTLPDREATDVVVNITVIDTGGLKGWDQSGPFTIKAPPPPSVEANYKPVVAVIFAIILAVAGVWSSKRRPWKGEKDRKAVVRAFTVTSMPFVVAEAMTGTVSFATGQLSIPPEIGTGMAVDAGILIAGLMVSLYRILRKV